MPACLSVFFAVVREPPRTVHLSIIWIFEVDSMALLFGIIEDEIVEWYDNIEVFTDSTHKGYGITLSHSNKYHAGGHEGRQSFGYGTQFKLSQLRSCKRDIHLDLSQSKTSMGLLSLMSPPNSVTFMKC
eukprot:149181_1